LRNPLTQYRDYYTRTTHRRYVAKLSRLQKSLLKKLWHWEAELDTWLETHPSDTQWQTVKQMREEGMDWTPRYLYTDGTERWTPKARASVSRALSRLEARGLVERVLFDHTHRTRLIRFTPRGRTVARRLTGPHWS
jgi:hypothetical protein